MELMTINVQDGGKPIQVCVNESNYGDELSRLRNYLKLAEAAFDAQEKYEEIMQEREANSQFGVGA